MFNIVNRNTGHWVHHDVVDSGTGDAGAGGDRVEGLKVEDDNMLLIEEDAFEDFALERTHAREIETFVPRSEIDEIYLDKSCYLVPQETMAPEAARMTAGRVRCGRSRRAGGLRHPGCAS